jgi:hypothetical protein
LKPYKKGCFSRFLFKKKYTHLAFMSKTKRHHFIPVFYLKQFTNENNQFYIYDVKKQTFRDKGRLFYPSQQFYEHYGNTIYYGEECDDIEQLFSRVDNEISAILKKLATTGISALGKMERMKLQGFVNILYWRIPANTDQVKAYIQHATSLKEFCLESIEKQTGRLISREEELIVLEKIKHDSDFHKYLKLLLPSITHQEFLKNHITTYSSIIQFSEIKPMPKLMSDNPIVYRMPGHDSLHYDDFIFPLSPTHILFRHRPAPKSINPHMRVFLDMLLLIQAHEYVSCVDKEYPQILLNAFQQDFSSSVHQLREKLFSCIHV